MKSNLSMLLYVRLLYSMLQVTAAVEDGKKVGAHCCYPLRCPLTLSSLILGEFEKVGRKVLYSVSYRIGVYLTGIICDAQYGGRITATPIL